LQVIGSGTHSVTLVEIIDAEGRTAGPGSCSRGNV
jgi:hypothetical protein